jgi:hypothetical protein
MAQSAPAEAAGEEVAFHGKKSIDAIMECRHEDPKPALQITARGLFGVQ